MNCFDLSLCVGYFVICSIKLYLWFFPIMFGYADTELYIHIHMVILDLVTDFPLLLIVIINKAYEISAFIYFDILYKLIVKIPEDMTLTQPPIDGSILIPPSVSVSGAIYKLPRIYKHQIIAT